MTWTSHDPERVGPPGSLQLLRAYESAIEQNIISSITDAKGTILFVNQRFCETSRYSRDELVGQNHRIVNSTHHPKEFFRAMWATIGRGSVWREEVKNRAKDGTFYWVDTVIVPLRNDQDVNTHYLSLRTLITDRKRLEKAKEVHLASLEVLLVMTAQHVHRPLADSLKQIDRFTAGEAMNKADLDDLMARLRASVCQLEAFTNDLTGFVRDMKL